MNAMDYLASYLLHLREEEKSFATIEKYERDIRRFLRELDAGVIQSEEFPEKLSKDQILAYKVLLSEQYAVSSANSMIVALNRFLCFMGRHELCVKLFRTQRQIFREETKELTKEEYIRMLEVARTRDERLFLLMETICSTGIRVSEHHFITVESLKYGYAQINNKGKQRTVFLDRKLCTRLKHYCKEKKIESGPVFLSNRGRPLIRNCIWRMMKNLAVEAGVSPEKVFPHNLRHLFAVTFYQETHDIVHLADLLGHSSMDTTRIYTKLSVEEHRNSLQQMDLLI